MAFKDFMNKVRYWDNLVAKWLMRHFYFMFFQFVLVIVFLFWFANTLNVVDANFQTSNNIVTEKLLSAQTINTTIIVLLLLLNSFWMLYIFNSIQRLGNILKDISYNLNKIRFRGR